MKSQKLLIAFSLVLAVLLIPQLTIASQVESTTTIEIKNEEAPYSYMYNDLFQFMYRVVNLTCIHEFLMNCTQNTEGINSTCDGECDCEPLQIQERLREMVQEYLNNTDHMFQFWFRHNE